MTLLDTLHARGFDASTASGAWRARVACSQCDATAINGVPAHETGCPNAMHECRGCNALVPASVRYCDDCC